MPLRLRKYVTDPIHGTIIIPDWLIPIIDEKPIRRMMFIRQLGLKSYIDFPGAIHTRYSHSLGVMHLAGRLIEMLAEKEQNSGNREASNNIKDNRNNIMAAGFFHDIGHGPFSHVVDYALGKFANTDHSELTLKIINKFTDLETRGIFPKKVHEIITRKHEHPFINDIVNGPMDADKLDYLLRDAYHVGFKYTFDLNHFLNNLRVLGDADVSLKHRELGTGSDSDSRVSAEIFFVIWKGMYDLVYHVAHSRIAEKMLEKSVILRAENDITFGRIFTDVKNNIDRYMELDDDKMLNILKNGNDYAPVLVNNIIDNKTLFSDIGQ